MAIWLQFEKASGALFFFAVARRLPVLARSPFPSTPGWRVSARFAPSESLDAF
jgi:hypothetical protein